MPKFITVQIYEEFYSTAIDFTTLFIEKGTRSKTICTDAGTGLQLIFEGRNFKYEDGRIDSGTIQKMTIANEDGDPIQSFSGMKLSAGIVFGASMLEFGNEVIFRTLSSNLKTLGSSLADEVVTYAGNDRLFGRGGDDTLEAGSGRDQLTGGAGLDTFVFATGQGRDTIMDFDPDGGAGNQDHIEGTFPGSGNVTQSGKDTIVDFGSGDIFVLKGVDATQIDATDFV